MYAIRSYYALQGTNYIEAGNSCAGIRVADGNTLHMNGTGVLDVYGDYDAPGIGNNPDDSIVITSYSIHYTKLYEPKSRELYLVPATDAKAEGSTVRGSVCGGVGTGKDAGGG